MKALELAGWMAKELAEVSAVRLVEVLVVVLEGNSAQE